MTNYVFFQNKKCEYFPCHTNASPETFNCLFCYCPLYALGNKCGGCFTFTEQGIKDCSKCLIPHSRENYSKILEKTEKIIDMAKKENNHQ